MKEKWQQYNVMILGYYHNIHTSLPRPRHDLRGTATMIHDHESFAILQVPGRMFVSNQNDPRN